MLSDVWSPLRLLKQEGKDIKKRSVHTADDSVLQSSLAAVGLRILTENSNSKRGANVVINSSLKSSRPIFNTKQTHENSNSHLDYCFLKSCFLCNKPLSLDKEVYMYRGDQGFCSIGCRNRQIYVDEMKELEISTKKTLAATRRCRDSNCRSTKTSSLLEEYRHRRRLQTVSCQKNRAVFI